jgi:hypothetical protein
MDKKSELTTTLLNVAWMSVLLGVGMELILLVVAAGFGKSAEIKAVVADLVQKISWSTLVCSGVALGTAVTKMRAPVMGLAGLVSGPLAFYFAKIMHKSATQALSVAGPAAAAAPSAVVLAAIKGAEYCVLGFAIGSLARNSNAGLRVHALTGFVVGLLFGGLTLYLVITQSANPVPAVGLVSRAVNEIIFPVGCSLVLYSAQRVGERLKKEDI